MKPNIKQQWLDALRSGKYDQGKGCLQDSRGRFCCLGVLTDLYSEEKNIPWHQYAGIDIDRFGIHAFPIAGQNSAEENYLTPSVQDWADENNTLARMTQVTLSEMNDNGSTFSEIANWIEKNL
jgi:hypothetical protein